MGLGSYELCSDTQDYFFTHGTKRVIEIGPMPTLSTLASRTLIQPEFRATKVVVQSYTSNGDAVYYLDGARKVDTPMEVEVEVEVKHAAPPPTVPRKKQKKEKKEAADKGKLEEEVTPTAVAVSVVPAAPVSASGQRVDRPLDALDVIQVLLALKMKKPIAGG